MKAGKGALEEEAEEEVPCTQCERKFLDDKHLRAHIKHVHTPKPKKGKAVPPLPAGDDDDDNGGADDA